MFRKFTARSAGLLATVCLATGSQAAIVTKNLNFFSNQFTLKAEVTYDNANASSFGGSATLIVHEFTTTLSNFTLPTLKVSVTPWYDAFTIGGGDTGGLDATLDDVTFSLFGSSAWGGYSYVHAPDDYSANKNMTGVTFNQTPYVPPAPSSNGVPEPGTLPLLALAGLGLVGTRRRPA